MTLQAIKTRILPGVSVNDNYRVCVFACNGKFHRTFSIDAALGRGNAHLCAVRMAIPMLGDGWQGNWRAGSLDGDYVWVKDDERTPCTDIGQLTLNSTSYLGQSA